VGTGQAMRLARDGNADVLLVHDRAAEERFVADGFGLERLDVMHNDFVLVGPPDDPAGAGGLDTAAAFRKIAAAAAPFASRGDDSGTHKKELKIWQAAGIRPSGPWYLESGTGMEATLRIASEKAAYCLVDRATWLSHQKEAEALAILAQGDPQLFNPYSVIVVSPAKFSWLNTRLATRFAEFIRSAEGQAIIRDFGKERFGAPLFFPRCRSLKDACGSGAPGGAGGNLDMGYILDGLRQGAALLLPPGREILQVIALSLVVSGTATVLASLAAIPAALFLALKEFRGKRLLVGLVNTAMAVPAVLIGLLVYGMVSRRGPLGALGLLFTPGP